jgi:hypothetical protein
MAERTAHREVEEFERGLWIVQVRTEASKDSKVNGGFGHHGRRVPTMNHGGM